MSDICVWNRCNNNCIMCTNPAEFQDKADSFLYSEKKVLDRVKSWKEKGILGKDNINLTGGEPTIHPQFLKILKEVRKIFPENRVVVVTNGRMLSYDYFIREVLKVNDLVLEIALHSYLPKMHDRITGVKGSFKQTIKGIRNFFKLSNITQEIEIRIVVTKINYKIVDKIIGFIIREFPKVDRVVIIFMEMEGAAKDNFKSVGLSHSDFNRYLPKIKKWEKYLKDIRLYHFPLCSVPSELWPNTWRTLRRKEVTFLPSCNKCLYKKYCLGIHKDYLELVGGKEFKPIRKRIKIETQSFFHHPIIGINKNSK